MSSFISPLMCRSVYLLLLTSADPSVTALAITAQKLLERGRQDAPEANRQ